jgi:hypothetical protein
MYHAHIMEPTVEYFILLRFVRADLRASSIKASLTDVTLNKGGRGLLVL